MSDLTTYFGNKIARWIAGNEMPTAPATVYVGLFDGDPKVAGVEVTDTIRLAGRVAISWGALAEGTGNVLTSNADADFGDAAGAADVSHIAVFDGPEEYAAMLAAKALTSPVSIAVDTPVKFLSGNISFTIGD